LGVELAERDLLLENTARGIDLLDRQNDSVAEIATGHRDASRYLADIDKLHVGGGCAACEQHQRCKREPQLRSSHESLPDDGPFAGLRYLRRSACWIAVRPVRVGATLFAVAPYARGSCRRFDREWSIVTHPPGFRNRTSAG